MSGFDQGRFSAAQYLATALAEEVNLAADFLFPRFRWRAG
jgi:hypothetical protein